MEQALGTLVWVVAAVGVVVAIVTLAGTAKSLRQIGGGGLTGGIGDAPVDAEAERDQEIRQMLHARNARRERRGEAPLDLDAELAALHRATTDAGLRDEVLQLVLARNERRVRAGKPALDVDAEVERRIRELT